MAIVYNGTKVELSSPFIPTGYTRPTVTTFDDDYYSTVRNTQEVTVLKSAVENVDPVVTLTNIVSQLDTDLLGIITNDYVATNTVDSYGVLKSITLNTCGAADSSDLYTNVAASYVCRIDLFVKVS